MRAAQIGRLYYQAGDQEKGMELVTKGIRAMTRFTSSPVPGFFRFTLFIDHYRNKRYEEALEETSKMDMPKFWCVQAFITAASAMLAAGNETELARTRLLEIWPEFTKTARAALLNLVGEEEVVGNLIESLRKAGLEISTSQ